MSADADTEIMWVDMNGHIFTMISVVGDGTVAGTEVLDAADGTRIEGVQAVQLSISAFGGSRANHWTADLIMLPNDQVYNAVPVKEIVVRPKRNIGVCQDCKGSGQYQGFNNISTCKACEGKGYV